MSNAVKQAAEFGVIRKGVQVAALFVQLSDIHALGLQVAQGLQLTAAFYWDLNDDTRAFSKRFGERMGGRMPTEDQAGVYASTPLSPQRARASHDGRRGGGRGHAHHAVAGQAVPVD